MFKQSSGRLALLAGIVGLGVAGQSASAAMVLTAAGIAEGFTLSTFVSQVPNTGTNGVGPVGIAFPGGNKVMVTGYATGEIRVFNDVDNLTWSAGTAAATNYGNSNPAGLTTLGGSVYLARQGSSSVARIDSAGNLQATITASGVPFATGIVGDPTTTRLYVSSPSNGPTHEIDAITGAIISSFGSNADGLTLSANILYAEEGGAIHGYDISNPAHPLVFNSGVIPGGPDGVAIGTGTLAGKLFVNTNGGTVVEVKISDLTQTIIATGGSRGDFVSVDSYNGSLLLTQTDSVLRLTPSSGGGFEGNTVPLPASAWMGIALLSAMAGYSLVRRRLCAC